MECSSFIAIYSKSIFTLVAEFVAHVEVDLEQILTKNFKTHGSYEGTYFRITLGIIKLMDFKIQTQTFGTGQL